MGNVLARAVLALALLVPITAASKPKEEQWKEAEEDRANTTTMISPYGIVKEVPDDQVDTHKLAGYRIETKVEYEARFPPDASAADLVRSVTGSPSPTPPVPERVNLITPEGEVASVERKDLEAAKAAGFVEETPSQAVDRYSRQAEEAQGWRPSTDEVLGILFGVGLLIVIAYSLMTSNDRPKP